MLVRHRPLQLLSCYFDFFFPELINHGHAIQLIFSYTSIIFDLRPPWLSISPKTLSKHSALYFTTDNGFKQPISASHDSLSLSYNTNNISDSSINSKNKKCYFLSLFAFHALFSLYVYLKHNISDFLLFAYTCRCKRIILRVSAQSTNLKHVESVLLISISLMASFMLYVYFKYIISDFLHFLYMLVDENGGC